MRTAVFRHEMKTILWCPHTALSSPCPQSTRFSPNTIIGPINYIRLTRTTPSLELLEKRYTRYIESEYVCAWEPVCLQKIMF